MLGEMYVRFLQATITPELTSRRKRHNRGITEGKRQMNTAEIREAMRRRFAAPEYALMFEVGNKTGVGCSRHADAIAMSLWPSRGLEIIGFEFKASRSDWLRELKNPAKAEKIAAYCDRWYIVAAKGCVKLDEMPVGWGYMLADDGTLKMVKKAPEMKAKEVDRDFIAAVLRRASEADEELLKVAVRREIQNSLNRRKQDIKEAVDRALRDVARENEQLKFTISEFEEASGIKLERWRGGRILGQAFAAAQQMGSNWDSNLQKARLACKIFMTATEEIVRAEGEEKSDG